MFSADLSLHTLQTLLVEMLVNCLAWRNKFLLNNALTVKKDNRHALDVCLASFGHGKDGRVSLLPMALSLEAISCISDAVFPSLMQNIMQMPCSFI
jgi:hypothetical protein